MFSTASIIYAWDNQARYAEQLLHDVTDNQMIVRPGGNMNHPAWILGHLSIYHPVVLAMLRGEAFEDPKDDPQFGFAGQGPVDDLSVYGTKKTMLQRYLTGHEDVVTGLRAATRSCLQAAPLLERWAEMYPTVEFLLPDLLLHHESIHVGQISIWRRAAGLPAVTFPDRTPRPGLLEGIESGPDAA